MIAQEPFRDPRLLDALFAAIRSEAALLGRRSSFMEVCGTHTHAIAEAGLRRRLAPQVRLISGPGCPVCVTPVEYLDRAIALGRLPGVRLATFGDLFRVPSSRGSLETAAAEGLRVEVVYSPRDALALASAHPEERVVFLAVGFETTAPAIAATLAEADRLGMRNFYVLSGHKVVPPPLRLLASDPGLALDGLLLPGHVSVLTGWGIFEFLATEFGLPSAVVGFTPADILLGVLELVRQRRKGEARVTNLYGRAVRREENAEARRLMGRYFTPVDSEWRGMGVISESGLALRPEWAERDAGLWPVTVPEPMEPAGCRCGEVLKGAISPPECPLFAAACDPDSPVGACMVSSEGTCAAWYRHERYRGEAAP